MFFRPLADLGYSEKTFVESNRFTFLSLTARFVCGSHASACHLFSCFCMTFYHQRLEVFVPYSSCALSPAFLGYFFVFS